MYAKGMTTKNLKVVYKALSEYLALTNPGIFEENEVKNTQCV